MVHTNWTEVSDIIYPECANTLTVLTLGDPHFSTNNVASTGLMSNRFITIAQKLQPDIIVVLGDILHNFSTSDVFPKKYSYYLLSSLYKIAPTYVLIGNHDRPYNTDYLSDNHFFNDLKEWGPEMTVIDRPIIVSVKGYSLLMAPYVEPGKLIQSFLDCQLTNWASVDVVFSHQEYKGCHMGKIVSLDGDVWDAKNPLAINGHIHSYQKLADNLICPGTPMTHRYKEGRDKTVSYYCFSRESGPEKIQASPEKIQASPDINLWYQEQRIFLDLPNKTQQEIAFEELETYQPPPDSCLKLVVHCNSEQYRCCLKTEAAKRLIAQGVNITRVLVKNVDKKSIHNRPESIVNGKRRFGECLYSAIQEDPQLKTCFESLFGNHPSLWP